MIFVVDFDKEESIIFVQKQIAEIINSSTSTFVMVALNYVDGKNNNILKFCESYMIIFFPISSFNKFNIENNNLIENLLGLILVRKFKPKKVLVPTINKVEFIDKCGHKSDYKLHNSSTQFSSTDKIIKFRKHSVK